MIALLFLCVCLPFINAEVEVNDDGVLVLTDSSFEEGLKSADFVLVEFYAPWCGHCKALAPEYAKAAKQLTEEHSDLNVKLAMVDATVQTKIAKEHNVRGYPTLMFFRNGQDKPSDYNGGRTASEIVNWIAKKTGPPAVDLADVEVAKKFVDSDEYVIAGFFSDAEAAKSFNDAAAGIDSFKFGLALNDDVKKHFEAKDDSIIAFRKFDEPRVEFSGDVADVEAISKFVKDNSLPYVIEFSDETAPKIFGGDVKTHALLFCKKSESEAMLAEYKKAAMANKGMAIFVFLDIAEESNSRVMEFFNLKAEDGTQFRVIRMGNEMEKFKAQLPEFTEKHFGDFVKDVVEGKVQKHLMTEEIPEDWDKEPVKVLVGKNFEAVAFDAAKDVLVEFYAPWCGHCKALAPIYEELGEHFKDTENVVVAKMDSTKNEISVEGLKVQGFPTIVLIRRGDNKVLTHSGGRTFDDLKTFVEGQGINRDATAEEADDEEEDGHDEL